MPDFKSAEWRSTITIIKGVAGLILGAIVIGIALYFLFKYT